MWQKRSGGKGDACACPCPCPCACVCVADGGVGARETEQVAAVMNCADNTGAKNLYIIAVKGIKSRLNRCVQVFSFALRHVTSKLFVSRTLVHVSCT